MAHIYVSAENEAGCFPEYRTLLTTLDRGVLTVALDRPAQRNAFGGGMREELADAYTRCNDTDQVRVVVLTGTPAGILRGRRPGAG